MKTAAIVSLFSAFVVAQPVSAVICDDLEAQYYAEDSSRYWRKPYRGRRETSQSTILRRVPYAAFPEIWGKREASIDDLLKYSVDVLDEPDYEFFSRVLPVTVDETIVPIVVDEPIPEIGFPPFPERLDLPTRDVSDPQFEKTSGPFKFEPHFFKPTDEERKRNADLTEEKLPLPVERNTNLNHEQPMYYKSPTKPFIRKLPQNQ